ncbi:MAG: hypothetical protein UT40_C0011G0037 [Candidatus Woesebacteria bacterium GW2011_GWA1_39_21b]|uniref:Uncharacterized protein n=1 Tax=Candidatus Woesebacteria bacterium GW2011_GWA1_39_21b TaxID=1618551 RepID=A0A0G0NLR0_9BACT|nr:MAG: hypothetical protein UT40_C0011G0037 [Candidatus Woesebacteria bacterium GW2011_GWA1_39_21b]KKS77212.1 MAG: hypothetical protein UV50_C0008G0074 [Parcubacteria group bacterium GW2011_GWB1_42_9]
MSKKIKEKRRYRKGIDPREVFGEPVLPPTPRLTSMSLLATLVLAGMGMRRLRCHHYR